MIDFTKEQLDVLVLLKQYVGKYNEGYKTMSIDQLLNARDFFSCHCYYLAEIVADLKKNYNDSTFIRKIEISRSKSALMKTGKGVGAAAVESDLTKENIARYEKELIYEHLALKVDGFLKAIYTICNSIAGRLRHLENEIRLTEQKNTINK